MRGCREGGRSGEVASLSPSMVGMNRLSEAFPDRSGSAGWPVIGSDGAFGDNCK